MKHDKYFEGVHEGLQQLVIPGVLRMGTIPSECASDEISNRVDRMNRNWAIIGIPPLVGIVILAPAPAWAQATPRDVVDQFYRWYLANNNSVQQRFTEQKQAFTPELYQELVKAFKTKPGQGDFLDFDPFFFNQTGGNAYTLGAARVFGNGNIAQVEVSIINSRGGQQYRQAPIIVFLQKDENGRWQISNLVNFTGGSLIDILKEINRGQRANQHE